MAGKHIHITGASGSGVSTLGAALAKRLAARHIDTDDYYWLPSDPPFQKKRDVPERLRLMIAELDPAPAWVVSGSLMVWGDALIPRFDLVVYLYAPAATRLARLSVRERGRFGTALDPGGSLHATHLNFMDWAAGYDTGAKGGRSLEGHRAWLAALPCAVLRLDGEAPTEALVGHTLLALASLRPE